MAAKSLENNSIYQTLLKGLGDRDVEILAPGIDGYEENIKRWSEAAEKRAASVVFPKSAQDVSTILKVVRDNSIEFVICCGRHSTGGASSIENGVVVDLKKMRNIKVDQENKTLAIQGGCTWKDVDFTAAKYGLATVGGTVNHTGVGGLILGGGFGWLSGRYGLTIDNLLSAELVLADGSIVRASNEQHQDLFWAIRGAGSSFAVATEFVLQAYDQPEPVFAGTLVFLPDKLPEIVKFANKHHEVSTDQAFMIAFGHPPPHHAPVVLAVLFVNGNEADAKEYFKDLYDLGPVADTTASLPYEQVNAMFNDGATFGDRKSSGASAVKGPLDIALVQDVLSKFTEFIGSHEGSEGSLSIFTLIPNKKIREIPLESTAYGNRGDYYNAEHLMRWTNPEHDKECRAFNRSANQMIRERGGTMSDRGVGAYPNNVEHQVGAKGVFGVNAERLLELKKIYDPANVFRSWHDLLHVKEERVKDQPLGENWVPPVGKP